MFALLLPSEGFFSFYYELFSVVCVYFRSPGICNLDEITQIFNNSVIILSLNCLNNNFSCENDSIKYELKFCLKETVTK